MFSMRKCVAVLCIIVLLFCCSCVGKVYKSSETFFMMDTVVTISADCGSEVIKEAFTLCSYYENMLSRTKEGSDIYKINNSDDFVEVNAETLSLIKRAIEYSNICDGKFDITVCPVSSLYDFNNKVLPDDTAIKEALKKIDYRKIEISENKVKLENGQLDLGAIAKGYITDKVVEFLKANGVERATVNMGGNVYCYGDKEMSIGIRKPFSDEIAATIVYGEATFVTSGIYQRYIEKDGKIYHHIIDAATGYGIENDLSSVTIIGSGSADADALSTVCMLLGSQTATQLIENTKNVEAVFIFRDNSIKVTSGLTVSGGIIRAK